MENKDYRVSSNKRTYSSYKSMIGRCYQPSSPKFKTYGEAGITVCDRWLQGFRFFLDDMGERPENMSLDRIDSTKGYSPENCRWATHAQQLRNTKANVWIEFNGERKVLMDWSIQTGIHESSIRARLRSGWTVEQALTLGRWGHTTDPRRQSKQTISDTPPLVSRHTC